MYYFFYLYLCPLFPSLRFFAPPIIASGWDNPTPARFREGVAAFEKLGLFDGTVIQPTRLLNGEPVSNPQNAFSSKPWQWKEFATALADLQASKPTTCTENFLALYSNPGDVDWFDDAGWLQVVDESKGNFNTKMGKSHLVKCHRVAWGLTCR